MASFRGRGPLFGTRMGDIGCQAPPYGALLCAISVFRQERRVTNSGYQEVTGASRATAKRDLEELVRKGLLILTGAGGGSYYQVPKKWLINGSNGSCLSEVGL